jgi:hypothetical protein
MALQAIMFQGKFVVNPPHSQSLKIFLSACLVLTLVCSSPENARSAVQATIPAPVIKLRSHFGGVLRAVAIQENKAFVGLGSRLAILDITDPSQPELLGITEAFPDLVENVVVSGNYAYVAATYAGVRIVDISDAANPQEVGPDRFSTSPLQIHICTLSICPKVSYWYSI